MWQLSCNLRRNSGQWLSIIFVTVGIKSCWYCSTSIRTKLYSEVCTTAMSEEEKKQTLDKRISIAGEPEPESSGGGSEKAAFAPRVRPNGTPPGLKRRARSGPLSPEGAEEAGDSVAEARARGELNCGCCLILTHHHQELSRMAGNCDC